MRNGDVYKIQSLARTGSSEEQIVHMFRNRYSREEVLKFIPKPKPKRGRPKKVSNDKQGIDLQSGADTPW